MSDRDSIQILQDTYIDYTAHEKRRIALARAILNAKSKDPSLTNEKIAKLLGCSLRFIYFVLETVKGGEKS